MASRLKTMMAMKAKSSNKGSSEDSDNSTLTEEDHLNKNDNHAKVKSSNVLDVLELKRKMEVLDFDLEEDVTDLDKKIIRQVEFYFGDYNLPKDRFILDLMDENEGWISMDTMMTFKRLQNLSKDPNLVIKALAKSNSGLMEVDIANMRIRRNPEKALPRMDDERRLALMERTVFVAGFDRDGTTLDDLIEFFEKGFEKVGAVRMRTQRNENFQENNNNNNKIPGQFLGSVFVTFTTRQGANNFLNLCKSNEGIKFRNRRLFGKWQKEFLNERTRDNDVFNPDMLNKTVFVQGFDKMETSDEELAEFFGQFPGTCTVRKRVFMDRKEHYCEDENEQDVSGPDWKFSGSVFVTFENSEFARRFLELDQLAYEGDALKSKWQKEFFESKGKFKRQLRELEENN